MLFGIFNFLARNPIAQAIAGLLGFLIFWKTNNAYQRRKGRVQGRLEVSEAVNEKTNEIIEKMEDACLLYTSPSPRDGLLSRMPSSA